jgi:hypothetical protein
MARAVLAAEQQRQHPTFGESKSPIYVPSVELLEAVVCEIMPDSGYQVTCRN